MIRPREAVLATGGGAKVWRAVADTMTGKVYGPHLEDLARNWTLAHAAEPTVGDGELDRLRHIRDLLPSEKAPVPPRLLLFSRSGFTRELHQTARTCGDVELVDLDRLYQGE